MTVRSGDTMSGIATRTGLWPLSAWRVPSGNLNLIYPGNIVTYRGKAIAVSGSTAMGSRAVSVTVRSGDTMSGIATRTGLWPLSAWRVPSGNLNLIYPGNIVTYRGKAIAVSGSTAMGSRVHVVKSGETLSGIFGANGWQHVAQLDNLANPNLIYPGQRLRY